MSLNSYLKDSHINRLIDANDEDVISYEPQEHYARVVKIQKDRIIRAQSNS